MLYTDLSHGSQEYQEYYENDPTAKCWDFPKAHTHKHVVRDIRSKGVTRNYNTKPNEKMHGPLKKIYLRRTNFKQVEKQVRRISQYLTP